MNKTEILEALRSGKEVVSVSNTRQIKLINEMLYFFIVGTLYSKEVEDDIELEFHQWTIH
jgi:hypothetical protein